MPSANAPSGTTTPRLRKHQEDEGQQRLDEAATVIFPGERPSEDEVIAAASLQMAFPRVAPERLKEAAGVLVKAMSGPNDEINSERLDEAARKIADVFAPE